MIRWEEQANISVASVSISMARSCTVPLGGLDASIPDDLLAHSGMVNKSTREAAYVASLLSLLSNSNRLKRRQHPIRVYVTSRNVQA